MELTYTEACKLVSEAIAREQSKILDVGCGYGSMSLELARSGHNVTGIDVDKEKIRIATRTLDKDPRQKRQRSPMYEVADFKEWSPSTNYDVVVFSRVLHDLPSPEKIVAKAHDLLRENGRIVCLEYAYDIVDRMNAIWLYQTRKMLEVMGWYSSHKLSDNPESGVEYILNEEKSERKEHINTFEEMRRPLEQLFQAELLSWHCYHSWDILGKLLIPEPRTEHKVAKYVKRMEQFLIESGEIQSVMFRFVGNKLTAEDGEHTSSGNR